MSADDTSPSVEVTDRAENAAQLADLIESLTVFDYIEGGDGYEKSADAMWKAAVAAFDYVAATTPRPATPTRPSALTPATSTGARANAPTVESTATARAPATSTRTASSGRSPTSPRRAQP